MHYGPGRMAARTDHDLGPACKPGLHVQASMLDQHVLWDAVKRLTLSSLQPPCRSAPSRHACIWLCGTHGTQQPHVNRPGSPAEPQPPCHGPPGSGLPSCADPAGSVYIRHLSRGASAQVCQARQKGARSGAAHCALAGLHSQHLSAGWLKGRGCMVRVSLCAWLLRGRGSASPAHLGNGG